MKLLITGASGFLGKYVAAAALRQGHKVRAVLRPAANAASLAWRDHPAVELVRLDLRQRQGLAEVLAGVDGVLHLAAVKAGDFYDRFAGTVITTENLLDAMVQTNVLRLVAISTFSVYDYRRIQVDTVLDEDSPIEQNPLDRDEYAQTKLIQEELIREFERDRQAPVTIIRPGMIYGRECLWHALLGAELGENRMLRIGAKAHMPMTYVENCAQAIIAAVDSDQAIGRTINIVDDQPPTQQDYTKQLLKRVKSPPKLIPINWPLMRWLGGLAWLINQRLLNGQAKLPSILVPAKLEARFKPLRYSNHRAQELLGWTPKYSLEAALDRSCSDVELLNVLPQKEPVAAANSLNALTDPD